MISGGPILDKQGLVFGYDTGSPIPPYLQGGRYSSGRPTTNYVSYQNAVPQPSYTTYSATSSGTWNAKHPRAIYAYNAQGNSITGYVNTGVGDWTNTYHAHWQYDETLGKPVVVMDAFDGNWKAKSFDCNTAAWTNYGMTTGSKYVISWLQWTSNISKAVHVGVYCKNSSSSNNFWDGLSGGSTTSKNTKPYTWQRVYHVYTVSSNHDTTIDYDNIYMYGHSLGPNSVGTTIKIADVQLELNTDFPSAYLDASTTSNSTIRTAAGSVRDLSRGREINGSDFSYTTAAGLPTFDGTDDYLLLNTKFADVITGTKSFAIEFVAKPASSQVTYADIWGNHYGDYTGIVCQQNGSTTNQYSWGWGTGSTWAAGSGNFNLTANVYNHVIAIRDGNTMYTYVNGSQVTSQSNTTSIAPSSTYNFMIGTGYTPSSGRFFNGEVPVFKLYNRALNSREIVRNYNSYKTRFGI